MIGNSRYYDSLYEHLPIVLQNAICSLYGSIEKKKRYGKDFYQFLAMLEATEWLSEEEIYEYQTRELIRVVSNAVTRIPYYIDRKEIYSDFLLNKRIEELPIITKDVFRNQIRDFLDRDYRTNELVLQSTSGTSGKPISIYKTRRAIAFQWAVWARHKHRFGIKFNDLHALFTGKPVVPQKQKNGPFFRKNKPMNQLVFGMLHTSPKAVNSIVQVLNKNPIVYYTGYPSIMYQVASTALSMGLKIESGPKVIFTGAEPVLEFQRDVIEACFGTTITDQYGTTEGLANASKCEYGNYHVDFEFGLLEILPDGLSLDPDVGEIVMTSFSNPAMPLIRYKIGDRGKFSNKLCKCGRKSKIIESLDGRSEDFILTPEGNRITRFDYIFKGVKGIEEAQVVQEKEGELIIRIVPNSLYSMVEQKNIIINIRKYISNEIVVSFDSITAIERTNNGKFRAVVNRL